MRESHRRIPQSPPGRKERAGQLKTAKPETKEHMRRNPPAVNREHQELAEWFHTVKFHKVIVGGVDERQLWRKLEELHGIYDTAIRAERVRYDTLLQANKKTSRAALLKYKQELQKRNRIIQRLRSGTPGQKTEREEQE